MVFFSALSKEVNNFWFCHCNLPLKMSAVIVCVKNTSGNSYFLTFPGADPRGSKRGRHGQIFEIVIFSKLVYKDGSDRYLYV